MKTPQLGLRYKIAGMMLLLSLGALVVISAVTLFTLLDQLAGFSQRLDDVDSALRSDVVGRTLAGEAADTVNDVDAYLLERINDVRRWSEERYIVDAARLGTQAVLEQGLDGIAGSPDAVRQRLQGNLFVPIDSTAFSNALTFAFKQIEMAETPFIEIIVTEAHGINVVVTRPVEQVAHAGEPWWQAAVVTNLAGIGITPAHIDLTTGLPVIGVALPVIDENSKEIIGVVHALISLENLQQRLSLKAISINTEIHLINDEGMILAHTPSDNASERVLNPEFNLLAADFAPAEAALSAPAGPAGAGFTLVETQDGRQVIGYARTSSGDFYDEEAGLSGFTGFSWGVLVAQSEDSALRVLSPLIETATAFARLPAQLGGNFIIVTVIIALAALGGAVVLSGSITRPLLELNQLAQRVQKGDLQAQVAIRTNDEVGQLGEAFNQMTEGLRQRERERDIFGRVVTPEVREKLLEGKLELGGETRQVTVLFSDIRSFTTISEKMTPQELVAFLNEYLTEMSQAVIPWGGYINNFIGDAIVAIFGAPIEQEDKEWHAVAAALTMRQRLEALNQRRLARGEEPIDSGIGISSGEAVAGQIGSLERLMYTVIGDAVNVAARLEALTKTYPEMHILINGPTAEAIRERPGIMLSPLGPLHVKGRSEAVDVFGVSASGEIPQPPVI